MKIDDKAIAAANRLVEALDKRDIKGYVVLAKGLLWFAGVLLIMILVEWLRMSFCTVNPPLGRVQATGVAVQACQVLVMLALAILGFQGYKGNRILHIIRHWNDGKQDACPTATKTNSD